MIDQTQMKSFAGAMLRRAAHAADAVRPPTDGLVILAYHRIGAGTDSSVDTPTDEFRRQMEWLTTNHQVVTLTDGVEATSDEGHAAAGTARVAVTFDDGTDDFADNALPVLAEFDVPATVYLATSFAELDEPFPWGAPPLSWSAARDAVSTGLVAIEAHTHEHRVMTNVSPSDAADDLQRCDDLITEHVGRRPRHFAYPKGQIANAAVEQQIRDRYDSAAGARVGVNGPGADVHRLRRTPIQRSDDARTFAAKVGGGMALEGTLREALNAVRYRKVTT